MKKPLDQYTWKDVDIGCVVLNPGSSREYKTGDWRSRRPVWEHEKCIKCGVCWNFCPDMSIVQRADGYFTSDLDYCKGCGICAEECWTGCITMHEEDR